MIPYLEIGVSANDALPLEYKLNNREPRREANLCDFVGESVLDRFTALHESRFEEQSIKLFLAHVGVTSNDRGDLRLIVC